MGTKPLVALFCLVGCVVLLAIASIDSAPSSNPSGYDESVEVANLEAASEIMEGTEASASWAEPADSPPSLLNDTDAATAILETAEQVSHQARMERHREDCEICSDGKLCVTADAIRREYGQETTPIDRNSALYPDRLPRLRIDEYASHKQPSAADTKQPAPTHAPVQ